MKQNELTSIIDACKNAVDNSWVGPIATYGGTAENPQKQVNAVAMQVYLTVLVGVLKNISEIEEITPEENPGDLITSSDN